MHHHQCSLYFSNKQPVHLIPRDHNPPAVCTASLSAAQYMIWSLSPEARAKSSVRATNSPRKQRSFGNRLNPGHGSLLLLFITAVPNTKLCALGQEDGGEHVL
jgi:hypothetical protein